MEIMTDAGLFQQGLEYIEGNQAVENEESQETDISQTENIITNEDEEIDLEKVKHDLGIKIREYSVVIPYTTPNHSSSTKY